MLKVICYRGRRRRRRRRRPAPPTIPAAAGPALRRAVRSWRLTGAAAPSRTRIRLGPASVRKTGLSRGWAPAAPNREQRHRRAGAGPGPRAGVAAAALLGAPGAPPRAGHGKERRERRG